MKDNHRASTIDIKTYTRCDVKRASNHFFVDNLTCHGNTFHNIMCVLFHGTLHSYLTKLSAKDPRNTMNAFLIIIPYCHLAAIFSWM
jgi:hypothetical protein